MAIYSPGHHPLLSDPLWSPCLRCFTVATRADHPKKNPMRTTLWGHWPDTTESTCGRITMLSCLTKILQPVPYVLRTTFSTIKIANIYSGLSMLIPNYWDKSFISSHKWFRNPWSAKEPYVELDIRAQMWLQTFQTLESARTLHNIVQKFLQSAFITRAVDHRGQHNHFVRCPANQKKGNTLSRLAERKSLWKWIILMLSWLTWKPSANPWQFLIRAGSDRRVLPVFKWRELQHANYEMYIHTAHIHTNIT